MLKKFSNQRFQYGALLVVAVIAVYFSSIFIKMSTAPASVIGFYRMLIASLLIIPFAWRERTLWSKLSWVDLVSIGCAGVFLGFHFVFWILSLKYTSVSSSTLIVALQPVLVACGAFFLFGERLNRWQQCACFIALCGTSLVGYNDLQLSQNAFLGDIYAFLGTIFAALYMLAGQKARTNVSVWTYNVSVFSIAALLLSLDTLIHRSPWFHYSFNNWILFLLLALVPTLLGHALFNLVLKKLPASAVSMTILGEPLGAILLAWLLLNQWIHWQEAMGGILLLTGVYLFLRKTSLLKDTLPLTNSGDGGLDNIANHHMETDG
ncbi:DMT family transporter [Alicyclobacillus sp. TC]|uniref:DMT family transporter n=1 Tax=Alicyclobacillus sp. TC TaxID=2606450 RepID=UPI0019331B31|nr:DMT family transporter [Alicyclobacillus sp. TC]QRF24108.1 DMT family transporter [Alicyclobacillus sp. TC]